MRSGAVNHLIHVSRSPDRDRDDRDQGFTLVELLIVITIMPLIMGALSLGLIAIFGLQNSVSNRIADTADAQVVSSTFLKDVQSSLMITTQSSSSTQCGTSTSQLLGLVWNGTGTNASNYQTIVSYDSVPVTVGSTTTYSLVRQYCTYGNSTPVSTVTVSYDIAGPSAQLPPCYAVVTTCNSSTSARTSKWIMSSGVPVVTFVVNELKSPFAYTLIATPRAWTATSPKGGSSQPPPFMLLGTSCTNPDLTLAQNATLAVDVNGGTNNGQIAIDSSCPNAATTGNNATMGVSSIITSNPGLNSVNPQSGAAPNPTEYYTSTFPDPYLGLVAPVPSGTPNQSCSSTGSGKDIVYTCPPGIYATLPSLPNGGTINFSGGNYTFNQDVAIPNNATVNFASGTYIFAGGNNQATDVALSTQDSSSIVLTGTNVLFYIPTGSVSFGNNNSISISPIPYTTSPSYAGVSIWAAGQGVNVNLGNNTNANTSSYGGVYVPNGTVSTSQNGTLSTSFIVASSANFANGATISITTQ